MGTSHPSVEVELSPWQQVGKRQEGEGTAVLAVKEKQYFAIPKVAHISQPL